jgi:hypothetical protein
MSFLSSNSFASYTSAVNFPPEKPSAFSVLYIILNKRTSSLSTIVIAIALLDKDNDLYHLFIILCFSMSGAK